MYYGIGDIHGQFHLVKEIHQKIMNDAEKHEGPHTVVFLGDYIDRGRRSKQVIDFLMENPFKGFEHVFLKGNHEQMLLDCLIDSTMLNSYFMSGGIATVKSYGLEVYDLHKDRGALRAAIDPHYDWLHNLKSYHKIDDYLFVHAGIRPGVPLEEQKEEVMFWVRDVFLDYTDDHGFIVVHGHTPHKNRLPEVKTNRINIDTMAYMSNVLTAVAIGDGEPYFIQATNGK